MEVYRDLRMYMSHVKDENALIGEIESPYENRFLGYLLGGGGWTPQLID